VHIIHLIRTIPKDSLIGTLGISSLDSGESVSIKYRGSQSDFKSGEFIYNNYKIWEHAIHSVIDRSTGVLTITEYFPDKLESNDSDISNEGC
jgi:hypothetical protein